NQEIAAFAAWLPAAGARELFGEGPTTVAGALFPPAAATRVEGGWRITGRCPFGSGCHNAKWLAMPAIEMEGDRPKLNPATVQPGKAPPAGYNASRVGERPLAQLQLGEAKARVEASGGRLDAASEGGYHGVTRSGGLLAVEAKIGLQLAACFAAEACAQAVRF